MKLPHLREIQTEIGDYYKYKRTESEIQSDVVDEVNKQKIIIEYLVNKLSQFLDIEESE